MKVIIAGGRDYQARLRDVALIAWNLRELDATEIVSGTAQGADRLGEQIGEVLGLKVSRFPAKWELEGKAAGSIRNQEMADYADALIALPGGRGTQDMVERAKNKGLVVIKVGWE